MNRGTAMGIRASAFGLVLLLTGGLAWASSPLPGAPIFPLLRVAVGYLVTVSGVVASPNPSSISATDPDNNPTPNSSSVTVVWTQGSGSTNKTWNIKVATPSSGCSTVPISAITVTCDSVTATNTTGWSGTCSAAAALTTSGTQIASGYEGSSTSRNITVILHYTFADSWKFVGGTCSPVLTYTVTAN
jgi:hypothetical protein